MSNEVTFEAWWDDKAQGFRVSAWGLDDHDGPVDLPGSRQLARQPKHPLKRASIAAINAADSAECDDRGLYWKEKSEAEAAREAAERSYQS